MTLLERQLIVASPHRDPILSGRCRASNVNLRLQKFAAVHAPIHNHFNQDRHLNRRNVFKQKRSVAWRMASAGGLSIATSGALETGSH
jgi:hypothetical protein